jgi:hypothetical protein
MYKTKLSVVSCSRERRSVGGMAVNLRELDARAVGSSVPSAMIGGWWASSSQLRPAFPEVLNESE